MKRDRDPAPLSSKAAAESSASPLPARLLSSRSLRTRILLPLVLLAIVPLLATGIFMILRFRAQISREATEQVKSEVGTKVRAVAEFLEAVRRDLRFLSQTRVIRDLADGFAAGAPESDAGERLREAAEEELILFSPGKRAYYQVRYLDEAGREVIRLNVTRGRSETVAKDELQDKSGRYYVTEALALEPGEIYVSRMDLNEERGRIEIPERPVIRYATRVVGAAGAPRGILIINLFAEYVFELLGPLSNETEAWLADEEGHYLGYVGPDAEKRELCRLDRKRPLASDHGPERAEAIMANRPGDPPRLIETAERFLASSTVPLVDGAAERRWTTILAYRRAPVEAPVREATLLLSVVLFVVVAVAGALAATVAHVFHGMTSRLEEAQERLSAWNAELEMEVTRKTAALQDLQAGLSRADKLSSIGQMTAGVLHEIGNPLAAIKAKIQVAEEEAAVCEKCAPLLDDVIGEVDRLATFLRSFARLSRMPEPRLEDVDLAAVVASVAALVTPELKRRGIALDADGGGDGVPTLRADPNQLRQLLVNLVLNAAESHPKSGVVRVRVRAVPARGGEPARAAVEVADDGVGIPEANREKIFEPFFTTKSDGSGLGLAICRRIAADHGGSIAVSSSAGEGTVITVLLPVPAAAAKASPRTA